MAVGPEPRGLMRWRRTPEQSGRGGLSVALRGVPMLVAQGTALLACDVADGEDARVGGALRMVDDDAVAGPQSGRRAERDRGPNADADDHEVGAERIGEPGHV